MSTWTSVPDPDIAARQECRRRRALLPAAALGTLGPILDRLAMARGTLATADDRLTPQHPTLVTFAADHGIAYAKVTAYPPGTTARRLTDLASGIGPIAQLAAEAGVLVRTVDVAVRDDLEESAVDRSHRVRRACGRIDMQDALREEELEECLTAGISMADAEIDGGADLLVGAICSTAVSTPAAALVSLLTGMEPVDATTRGSGIDDAAWIAKCGAVRDARFRAREANGDARAMLRIAGGPDLAALTGFIAQAALRRVPVLIDDVPSLVCAVLANRLAPGAENFVIAADTTTDRTASRLHTMLGVRPIVDRKLGLGSGAGALLTLPALRSAARLLDQVSHSGAELARTEQAVTEWDPNLL